MTLQGKGDESEQKRDFVRSLGPAICVALVNGATNALMVKTAALGIGVLGRQGLSTRQLAAADVSASAPEDALDLLPRQNRLTATLRR